MNWVPKQAGFWELRWGYSTVTMNSTASSAIHSMFPYRTWDGTKYVLFMSGTTLQVLNTGTGVVTTPTVRGAAVGSSAKGAGYFANNRFHYGNGTDQKWFDGTTWRTNGLRAPTSAEVQNVTIVDGVRELTTAENTSITFTPAGGGQSAATSIGLLFYVAIFDSSNNERGPATIVAGSGARVNVALNQKVTVATLPNLSGVNANWIKVIATTYDGGNVGYFVYQPGTLVQNASVSRAANVVTIGTQSAHGRSVGDIIVVNLVADDSFNGVYKVASVPNSATLAYTNYGPSVASSGGSISQAVTAANAATSVDVLATQNLVGPTPIANENRGLAQSTVGGSNPGYQFYGAIYNPNGGGHAGNRIAIGGRYLPGKSFAAQPNRCNFHIQGLPDYSGTDTEWSFLVGRTGDGVLVPYVATDNAGNWLYGQNGSTSLIGYQAITDGNHELPTRNGIIPAQSNMFAVAGDYCYAADTGSPTLRRSGSLADDRSGVVTGRPEQSWAANDIDTFPTGEAATAIFEIDQEILMGTLHDCALSVNLAGIQQWVGPFNVGIAGRRAGTKCGSHGFFWLSGDKQLVTLQNGVPVVVSDEYEAAELFKIDSTYLSQVELVYYRNAQQGKDELRIEGQSGGVPYTVKHDFKLREYMQAPGSVYGQGYAEQYVGQLSNAFTVAQVRDATGALQIYAGSTNGQLYQLYSGADDIGNQYAADLILLVNGGTDRPSVPFIDWYGDSLINVSVGKTLSTSLAAGAQFAFEALTPSDNPAQAVQGAENDSLYRAYLSAPEIQHVYLRFQLSSHSADGNLALNSPPHVPLETYGRLYELIPAIGDERER
ncbi:MAG: hypothetical protein JO356_01090 [Acidobacteria bacterium]|nr:hypothetical protein [Acidobacteriota bacterium]